MWGSGAGAIGGFDVSRLALEHFSASRHGRGRYPGAPPTLVGLSRTRQAKGSPGLQPMSGRGASRVPNRQTL
jgi:hypothetical protein